MSALTVADIAQNYGENLQRYLARHAPRNDLSDLVQQTYERLLAVKDLDALKNPQAYLITVARSVLSRHFQREGKNVKTTDIVKVTSHLRSRESEEPESRAQNSQELERFEKFLKTLAPREAAVLVMHRLHGYTLAQVATALHITRGTAKSYLAQSLAHWRRNQSVYGG